MSDLVNQLMETPLGTVFNTSEAADLVQEAKQRSVGRSSYLFRAGDQGEALFVVLQGSFDIVLGPPGSGTKVSVASAGQVVGELEVMTKSLRAATLVAREDSQVLELSGGQLDAMLAENRSAAAKLVVTIARTLARRLAAVNARIISKPSPASPAAPEDEVPIELGDDDIEPISVDDDDLAVLDELWS